MQDMAQWAEKNRPADDPDYQRLAAVTESTESEMQNSGARQVLNHRFDYDVALKCAVRRIEETSQKTKLENPDVRTLLGLLCQAWAEGFIFGSLAYVQEHRGRAREALLDRVALANINHKLSTATQDALNDLFARSVSDRTLNFVSMVRSARASQVLREMAAVADHRMVNTIVSGHWLDGFLVGLVFQEMGGHQER